MTEGMILFSVIMAGAVQGGICLFFIYRLRKAGRHKGRLLLRECLAVVIFYGMAVSLWRFLFSAGLGILFRSEAFLDKSSAAGQTAGWMVNLLLAVLVIYIAKGSDITEQKLFRLLSAAALCGFFAVVTLGEQTVIRISDDTVYMWLIQSLILMMSVLIFRTSRQYEMEKELGRLRSEQAELLERDYTALNRAYAVNARLFHDFHNHIGALRQLLLHGKYEEAVTYLNELQEPVREMTDTVWTGDETVDYLINSKAAAAAEDETEFKVQVEYPRGANIRSADLCAILGNLLDNALEAAKKVENPEERTAALTIRRINQMVVIKVENSFAGRLREENGALKTTKTEGGLHGWGMKSAQAAAEKYDGMVQTAYEGNLFRAVVTLSYKI